jgi:hypothetical protein
MRLAHLKDVGDTVEVEVEGIGVLASEIRRSSR